jgi:hypothetical protein
MGWICLKRLEPIDERRWKNSSRNLTLVLFMYVYFPLDRAFDCIGAALNFINMRSVYLKKPLRGTMKISRREITKRL